MHWLQILTCHDFLEGLVFLKGLGQQIGGQIGADIRMFDML